MTQDKFYMVTFTIQVSEELVNNLANKEDLKYNDILAFLSEKLTIHNAELKEAKAPLIEIKTLLA